jgi:hypothetical protein
MTLTLDDTWNDTGDPYSAQGLERPFVHELGHFVGLNDYDAAACGVSDAAMQDQLYCRVATVMNNPTFSDTRPVVNTTYGGGTTTTCGF